MPAGGDGFQHALVGDRGGVAFALQLELGLIDAARDVGRQHQQQVDLLGGARHGRRDNGRRGNKGQQNQPGPQCKPHGQDLHQFR